MIPLKKSSLDQLKRLNKAEFRSNPKLPILLCADHIRSGHNIGSLFRIADAFTLQGILLSEYCVHPPHPEIEKTALGSTDSVIWNHCADLTTELKSLKLKGYTLVGIEQTDESILLHKFSVETDRKYILILGNEISGITNSVLELLDISLEIPQFGTKHSLNVSVAAGIASWHFVQNWID